MTRNHLLILSMQSRRPVGPSVWRMTLDVLGRFFGAPPARREPRR